MENFENYDYDYLVEGPRMGQREDFIRVRPPKPVRKSEIKRPTGPGGIRQRRSKHWNW